MGSDAGQRVERAVGRLSQTSKYKHLHRETLERIAAWACARYRSDKEVLKAAKRKLHQVYAAYVIPGTAARLARLVAEPGRRHPESLSAICRQAMELHASTAERLPIVEEVYQRIFAVTGSPRRVLDLASGLHPFSLPWMKYREIELYSAMDVDCQLMALMNAFFSTHLPGVLACECRDILVRPPDQVADVAFLLKTVPCLEQQEKGASLRLLRSLKVRPVVVSFPARSLGGRNKGMEAHYARLADDLVERLGGRAEALRFPGELFYVIDLRPRAARGYAT